MRKPAIIIIIVLAVLVIAGGGYALMHKSSSASPSGAGKAANQSTNAPAVDNRVVTTKTASNVGQYLADPNGKPLYIYNADTSGTGTCTGGCLSDWPVYVATSTANLPSGIGVITRSDNGQKQYTYNGKPLYYFTGDTAGKVTGNGVEGFSVAVPAASGSGSDTPVPATGNSSASGSTSGGYDYHNYTAGRAARCAILRV